MKAKRVILSIAIVTFLLICAAGAQAETLSWNAVTTYTDGSSIGSATVTYTAVWSTSSSLSSPTTLVSATSTTSTTFSISTAGMPRGSTIYFGVKATVASVDSAYSTLSWLVPNLSPAAPGRPRVQ